MGTVYWFYVDKFSLERYNKNILPNFLAFTCLENSRHRSEFQDAIINKCLTLDALKTSAHKCFEICYTSCVLRFVITRNQLQITVNRSDYKKISRNKTSLLFAVVQMWSSICCCHTFYSCCLCSLDFMHNSLAYQISYSHEQGR